MAPEERITLLRSAPRDCWVALSEDGTRIVAHGPTFESAATQAEKEGVSDPILIKTPKEWTRIAA